MESVTRSRLVQLDDHHVRIARAASTDDTRPSLCAVNVTADRIEATDGHMLIQCDPPADMPEDMHGLYRAKDFARIKQLGRNSPAVASRTNGFLVVNEGHGAKATNVDCVDGQYPNTDQVWPKDTDADIRIGLRADMLKKLVASLPNDDAHVWITVPKESVGDARIVTGALTFTVTTGYKGSEPSTVRGLLMPCRWPEDK